LMSDAIVRQWTSMERRLYRTRLRDGSFRDMGKIAATVLPGFRFHRLDFDAPEFRGLTQQQVRHLFHGARNAASLPFESVLFDVGRRNVFLWKGRAFVSPSHIMSALVSNFSLRLDDVAMDMMLPPQMMSIRLAARRFIQRITSGDSSRIGAVRRPLQIECVPPCIRNIINSRSPIHMKFPARTVFGFILARSGIDMAEVIPLVRNGMIAFYSKREHNPVATVTTIEKYWMSLSKHGSTGAWNGPRCSDTHKVGLCPFKASDDLPAPNVQCQKQCGLKEMPHYPKTAICQMTHAHTKATENKQT